jgi:hypothetical protein
MCRNNYDSLVDNLKFFSRPTNLFFTAEKKSFDGGEKYIPPPLENICPQTRF